jgi:hypothetical protein
MENRMHAFGMFNKLVAKQIETCQSHAKLMAT